jgi:hypothetical protein
MISRRFEPPRVVPGRLFSFAGPEIRTGVDVPSDKQ